MQNTRKNTTKRQVPEAFEVGDQVEVNVTVMGVLVRKEAAAKGDWLFSIEPAELTTCTTETVVTAGGDRKVAKRIRTVMWSVADDGGIELVLDVGQKQLLRSVGVSAKRRQSIREDLAVLTASEAKRLLSEVISDADSEQKLHREHANTKQTKGFPERGNNEKVQ